MKFLELARMTTATTGTGTITLGSAVTGNISFSQAGAVTGDVVTYGISDGANSEIGWGVYNSTGPTITRNPVNSTAGVGTAISLSGNAEVFATVRPADLVMVSAGLGVGGPPMINGTLSVTASASTLIIALKTLAGTDPSATDPVDFSFPNDTGGYSIVRQQAALSLTIPSTATMGVNSGTAFRLWFVVFNDAGTLRIGVILCSTPNTSAQPVYALGDGTESSTIMNTASDNVGVIYTGTAVTSKPMRIIGYAEWNASGVATAGTWTTTNMIVVRLFGPGVAAPGDIVQIQQAASATATNASATTAVTTTNLTKSFTRKSICNVVRVEAHGVLSINTAGMVTTAALYKAGSTIVNASGAAINDESLGGGTNSDAPAALMGMDFTTAGQANPVTYDVRIANSTTTGTGTWGRNGVLTNMVMTEIQV